MHHHSGDDPPINGLALGIGCLAAVFLAGVGACLVAAWLAGARW